MTDFEATAWRFALAAALIAALGAGGPAAAGEPMSPDEIRNTFSGMTLDGVYSDGQFFSETYREDGAIRYHDAESADSGEWSVENGRFCTFYETGQGACFFVQREGSNCFSFFAPKDPDAKDPVPEADWTSRGWDRSKPPTCPTTPEIQL